MIRKLRWLSLYLLFSGLIPAKAAENICEYRLDPLDQSLNVAELEITCDNPLLLKDLNFLYPAIRPFTQLIEDNGPHRRYRLRLRDFAIKENDPAMARRQGESFVLSPDMFMPTNPKVALHRLYLAEREGINYAAAYDQATDGAYLFSRWQLRQSGPFVLGKFQIHEIPGEAGMKVALLDGKMRAEPAQLFAWVEDLAKSNSRFWGRPPVPKALVILTPSSRDGLSGGKLLGGSGAVVLMNVEKDLDPPLLYEEWVGVHEFLHLGTPITHDKGAWFNEGLATYFEPILRYRAGWKKEEEIWQEWLRDMPRGYNAINNQGLAPAGRRGAYWGGALFMLLSDIELRKASGGSFGMEDCLKAIFERKGGANGRAKLSEMLEICDLAAGNKIVSGLGAKYIDQGTRTDFDRLWKDLGVSMGQKGEIYYDDKAPLAKIRHWIVNGSNSSPGIPKTMPLN